MLYDYITSGIILCLILFRVASRNADSIRYSERVGRSYEGVKKGAYIFKDDNYEANKVVEELDFVISSTVHTEWPVIKRVFEEWLNDKNFDENGRQKQRFDDIRWRVYAEEKGR